VVVMVAVVAKQSQVSGGHVVNVSVLDVMKVRLRWLLAATVARFEFL